MPTTDIFPSVRRRHIVLLGGPPGSGKSTVATALASTAERPTVHLHSDTFYAWIRSGFVPPYLPAAQRQNEVVHTVMLEAAKAYAGGGYDVILDGIIGPWSLEGFHALALEQENCLSYVILRPHMDVVLARATLREERQLREVGPITGLYRAFEDLGPLEKHVVDSSAQCVEETSAEISAGLRTDRFSFSL